MFLDFGCFCLKVISSPFYLFDPLVQPLFLQSSFCNNDNDNDNNNDNDKEDNEGSNDNDRSYLFGGGIKGEVS
jgi:hypothetical protein